MRKYKLTCAVGEGVVPGSVSLTGNRLRRHVVWQRAVIDDVSNVTENLHSVFVIEVRPVFDEDVRV